MRIGFSANSNHKRRYGLYGYCLLSLAIALVVSLISIPWAGASPSSPPDRTVCVRTTLDKGKPTSRQQIKNATIAFINPERTVIQASCDKSAGGNLKVSDETLISRLASFSVGDVVDLTYASDNVLNSISIVKVNVSSSDRVWAFGKAALIILLGSVALLGFSKANILAFRELFVGLDKRLSNSQTQAAIWFFALTISYLAITFLRIKKGGLGFVVGISIPHNLWLLAGFSTFTFAGSKAITESQMNRSPESKPPAAQGSASLADYLTDDEGNTDFGDFQMSVVTLLAVTAFLVQIFNYTEVIILAKNIEMPDLDTTILSLFGLSQGGYLVKKAAAASAPKEPEELKIGMKDARVKEVKKALNRKLGLSGNSILNDDSDLFDAATSTKVRQFQAQKGLNETGTVDPKTYIKLLE